MLYQYVIWDLLTENITLLKYSKMMFQKYPMCFAVYIKIRKVLGNNLFLGLVALSNSTFNKYANTGPCFGSKERYL